MNAQAIYQSHSVNQYMESSNDNLHMTKSGDFPHDVDDFSTLILRWLTHSMVKKLKTYLFTNDPNLVAVDQHNRSKSELKGQTQVCKVDQSAQPVNQPLC